MAKKDPYRDWLKQDFGSLFDGLNLENFQKHYLKSRWLDQVLWSESKAAQTRNSYYNTRLTAIVGGVIVPVLVSLNLNGVPGQIAKYTSIVLSGTVAVSAAVEEFFRYGERWQHYRRTAESLKSQGWQFFQLSGTYRNAKDHTSAYVDFVDQIEEIIQRDVEVFVTQVAKEKKKEEEGQSEPGPAQESTEENT